MNSATAEDWFTFRSSLPHYNYLPPPQQSLTELTASIDQASTPVISPLWAFLGNKEYPVF